MNVTGIITEYNPFHNGHFYHLSKAKSIGNSDAIVCVMSGNFVQRGEVALIDKWNRAKMAVLNGVDLVIELPTFYALSSAELFAKGAIDVLNSLNIVDNIVFGSECGDIEILKELSLIITTEPDEYKLKIKKFLSEGIPYPKAREKALISIVKNEKISKVISSSNNILGIEYIKALIRSKSKMEPLTLTREGASYNSVDLEKIFSSATSIRKALLETKNLDSVKNQIPLESYEILKKLQEEGYDFCRNESIFQYLKYKIATDCTLFNNLLDVKEGLDNKIINEIYNSNSLNELILRIKSKRYTYTRISRILCQIFIGFDRFNYSTLLNTPIDYCRVLAFNNKGREILKEIKNNSDVNIITKFPKKISNPHLTLDMQATKAYSIINSNVNFNDDYLISPYYHK